MDGHIDIETRGAALVLTMNRPDKKNALTDAMYGQLLAALEQAEDDSAIRVVAILGAGESFCAGNDIGDFLAAASGGNVIEANVFRFIRKLGSFTKPLVAGVQGKAVGIGTTMLLHCDYVVLAEDAKLITPFTSLGLVPEAASSDLLPARIGHARAFAMLGMGEPMGAKEAQACGIANTLVSLGELEEVVAKAAERLAQLPPDAIRATKALMRDAEAIDAKMLAEIKIFGERLQSAEAREAFTAFMEKRAPDFSKV